MGAMAAPDKSEKSAIYAKGGVWTKIVEKVKLDSKHANEGPNAASKPDAYLFIVGDRGSGKVSAERRHARNTGIG